jgi:hypothetical protein
MSGHCSITYQMFSESRCPPHRQRLVTQCRHSGQETPYILIKACGLIVSLCALDDCIMVVAFAPLVGLLLHFCRLWCRGRR